MLMNWLMGTKIFAAIQSSILLYGVSKGLGKSVDLISPADFRAMEKVSHQTDPFYTLMDAILLGRLRK